MNALARRTLGVSDGGGHCFEATGRKALCGCFASLSAGRMQCKVFAPPELLVPYFKPPSTLSKNQYHGSWADEDASGKGDDIDQLRFGTVILCSRVRIVLVI